MALVDADYKFIWIDVGASDAQMLRFSTPQNFVSA